MPIFDYTWFTQDLASVDQVGVQDDLTFPLGKVGDLTVGKTKEPFAYEMVGDAANLPQVERLMSPFFVSRNIGLRWM